MNSIVNEYLHESIILALQRRMNKYTDTGGTTFS